MGQISVIVSVGVSPLCVGSLFVVKLYVSLFQSVPSVRFRLHQYLVPGLLKLLLVCVMLVLLLMVLLVAKSAHGPELFDFHVAFMVSLVSLSLTIMYSVGMGHMFVVVLVGASLSLTWYGALFAAGAAALVVKL